MNEGEVTDLLELWHLMVNAFKETTGKKYDDRINRLSKIIAKGIRQDFLEEINS